ncbi:hypothetical protein [Actinacidiphila glaucinigra]|uniref:hypothetical protein n=1 Tax=Actinacidiphila glaucinigra TaxID=235986 RepID=UPI003670D1D4
MEEVARTGQVQFGAGGVFDLDRRAAFTAGHRSVISLPGTGVADVVTRLWWKRLTDFWKLDFYLGRQDPTFGQQFLVDEDLLHWWTDHFDQVQAAYASR